MSRWFNGIIVACHKETQLATDPGSIPGRDELSTRIESAPSKIGSKPTQFFLHFFLARRPLASSPPSFPQLVGVPLVSGAPLLFFYFARTRCLDEFSGMRMLVGVDESEDGGRRECGLECITSCSFKMERWRTSYCIMTCSARLLTKESTSSSLSSSCWSIHVTMCRWPLRIASAMHLALLQVQGGS